MLRAKLYDEPKRPAYFLPELDQTLSAVICKAIERAPHDRHQSAAELLDALLRPSVANEARSETSVAPARLRKPWVAPVVAAAVLAALASLTWLSHRVEERSSVPGASATARS